MKHLLYILLQVIIFGQSFNIKPVEGDMTTFFIMDSIKKIVSSPGQSGTNVLWDFSNISDTIKSVYGYDQEIKYNLPGGDSLTIMCPDANLVLAYVQNFDTVARQAYKVSNNQLDVVGFDQRSANVFIYYSDYKTELKYPLTMGLAFTDSFSAITTMGYNSNLVLDSINGQIDFIADGIGTLKVNGKTFNNVIRVRLIQKATHKSSGSSYTQIDTMYKFYYGLYPDPVFGLVFSAQISNRGTFYSSYGVLLTDFMAKITNEPLSAHIRIFPTQTEDKAYIYFSEALNKNARIELINILGETIYSDKINTTYNKKYELNVKNLPDGIYFLKIIINDEYLTRKIIKL